MNDDDGETWRVSDRVGGGSHGAEPPSQCLFSPSFMLPPSAPEARHPLRRGSQSNKKLRCDTKGGNIPEFVEGAKHVQEEVFAQKLIKLRHEKIKRILFIVVVLATCWLMDRVGLASPLSACYPHSASVLRDLGQEPTQHDEQWTWWLAYQEQPRKPKPNQMEHWLVITTGLVSLLALMLHAFFFFRMPLPLAVAVSLLVVSSEYAHWGGWLKSYRPWYGRDRDGVVGSLFRLLGWALALAWVALSVFFAYSSFSQAKKADHKARSFEWKKAALPAAWRELGIADLRDAARNLTLADAKMIAAVAWTFCLKVAIVVAFYGALQSQSAAWELCATQGGDSKRPRCPVPSLPSLLVKAFHDAVVDVPELRDSLGWAALFGVIQTTLLPAVQKMINLVRAAFKPLQSLYKWWLEKTGNDDATKKFRDNEKVLDLSRLNISLNLLHPRIEEPEKPEGGEKPIRADDFVYKLSFITLAEAPLEEVIPDKVARKELQMAARKTTPEFAFLYSMNASSMNSVNTYVLNYLSQQFNELALSFEADTTEEIVYLRPYWIGFTCEVEPENAGGFKRKLRVFVASEELLESLTCGDPKGTRPQRESDVALQVMAKARLSELKKDGANPSKIYESFCDKKEAFLTLLADKYEETKRKSPGAKPKTVNDAAAGQVDDDSKAKLEEMKGTLGFLPRCFNAGDERPARPGLKRWQTIVEMAILYQCGEGDQRGGGLLMNMDIPVRFASATSPSEANLASPSSIKRYSSRRSVPVTRSESSVSNEPPSLTSGLAQPLFDSQSSD